MTSLVLGMALAATPTGACPAGAAAGWAIVDGYLLSPGELVRLPGTIPFHQLAHLDELRSTLAERGTVLAVAAIPPRPSTIAAARPTFDAWWEHRVQYHALVRTLSGLGLAAPDLLDVADELGSRGQTFFYTQDHHFTPEASEASAAALAAAVRAVAPEGHVDREERIASPGDPWVLESTPLGNGYRKECPDDAFPQLEGQVFRGEPIQPLGLLDVTPPPEVVLVGSSYSRERFNLATWLEVELGLPGASLPVPGGRAIGGISQYLHSEDFDSHPPAVLVWEFSLNTTQDRGLVSTADHRFWRQIIAASRGACSADEAVHVATAALEPGASVEVASGLDVDPATHDLFLVTEQAETGDVVVEVRHADGAVDETALIRSPRTAARTRFFLELDEGQPATASAVSVTAPAGMTGAVELRVCAR